MSPTINGSAQRYGLHHLTTSSLFEWMIPGSMSWARDSCGGIRVKSFASMVALYAPQGRLTLKTRKIAEVHYDAHKWEYLP